MRHNLITTFHCYGCGKKLEVDYGRETNITDNHSPDDPPGAMVCYNKIVVKPCGVCIAKYTEPARKIADGLKEMLKETP